MLAVDPMDGMGGGGRREVHSGRRGWGWVPGLTWLVFFVVVPLVGVLCVGFLTRSELGEIERPWTLENYRRLAGYSELGFDPLYPRVMIRTLAAAGGATLLTLVAAMPLAFFIAGLRSGMRGVALTLVVIPFWTNLLVRTYAWQLLLGAGGPASWLLALLGWVPEGTALQPGWFAVVTAMVCDFLPFMVLPLYASVERLDWTLAEAAADLGANRWKVFRHALLPQIQPGIRAGLLLVFLPATGQFVIPDLLGGGQTTLLGNLIQQQFSVSRDWPFGAALATVALVLLLGMRCLQPRRMREGGA